MLNRSLSFAVAGAAGAATLTAASAPSPLYPVYQRLWGFDAFTLTVVFAVYVLALLASLLTVGSLSDRVGRRPVVSVALVLLALGMVLFATAGGVADLVAARVVQGVAVGAATGTVTAMVMDAAPSPRAGSALSSAVPTLGIALGAVLAGGLVEHAPYPRQLVFWVLGATHLALAGVVWAIPERGPHPGREEDTAPADRAPLWRELLPSAGLPTVVRPTFLALVPTFCATWALGGLYLSLGSSVLGSVLGVRSHLVVGLVLGAFFAAGTLGTLASTAVPAQRGTWAGHVALVVGVLLTVVALLASALPLYVVGSVVAGVGFGAAFRAAVGALGEAAPPDRRGQVFATMYVVSYLAFSVPALVAGLVVGHVGLRPTAVAYGLLDVALVLVALLAARPRAGGEEARLLPRTLTTRRHTTHYLEAGPADGPLMLLVHGWPGTGLVWRAQMAAFADDGWHCVAPDLRGYGGSAKPGSTEAYTVEEAVTDLVELHEHLGGEPAVWVGHDWGSVVVGAMAAHEPSRSRGVVLTSWAYQPDGTSLATLVPLVDRTTYPADRYPDGQWDYYRYYTTDFGSAVADLDADPAATLASIYRRGSPDAVGSVSPSALVTRHGGRFGDAHRAPPTAPDPALWPPADFEALVRDYADGGFRGPCAWYTNDAANAAYAQRAPDRGRLSQPVLFVDGRWDPMCSIDGDRQGDPMRAACADLTVVSVPTGHWLPLERADAHVDAIRQWLAGTGLDQRRAERLARR